MTFTALLATATEMDIKEFSVKQVSDGKVLWDRSKTNALPSTILQNALTLILEMSYMHNNNNNNNNNNSESSIHHACLWNISMSVS